MPLSTPGPSPSSCSAPHTGLLLVALACALLALGAERAGAKDCGGQVACACGDRVVGSAVLTQSLNNCEGDGLVVATGTLDCNGRQIAGPGDRTESVGVLVRGFTGAGAQGAQVRNCRVRNFGRGIEIDSGSGNTLSNNVVFNNDIGIWLGDGTSGNLVEDNHVRDNRDEGIHVGGGSSANEIARNSLVKNKTENLYLVRTHGNLVHHNVIDDSDSAAILLKNSDDNELVGNEVKDRNVLLRGDSNGNVFRDNVLAAGYFNLHALEEGDVWGYPHDNHVIGGELRKASTCFEFNGAYENTVSDVLVDTCRTKEEKESGGVVPYGNLVEVIRVDVGEPNYHGRRRSGSVRLSGNERRPDRLRIDVRGLEPSSAMDPANEEIGCSLADFQGTICSFSIPAGILERRQRGARLVDPSGSRGGLQRLDFHPMEGGRWRIKIIAKTDLAEADFPVMTLACYIGDDDFEFTDFWKEHSRGWNLSVQQ